MQKDLAEVRACWAAQDQEEPDDEPTVKEDPIVLARRRLRVCFNRIKELENKADRTRQRVDE